MSARGVATKTCPKCGSLLRQTPTRIPDKFSVGPISIDLKSKLPEWLRRAMPYICESCGYVELYVE